MRVAFARMDAGAKIGFGIQVGNWRRGWRMRNPFFRHDPPAVSMSPMSKTDADRQWTFPQPGEHTPLADRIIGPLDGATDSEAPQPDTPELAALYEAKALEMEQAAADTQSPQQQIGLRAGASTFRRKAAEIRGRLGGDR